MLESYRMMVMKMIGMNVLECSSEAENRRISFERKIWVFESVKSMNEVLWGFYMIEERERNFECQENDVLISNVMMIFLSTRLHSYVRGKHTCKRHTYEDDRNVLECFYATHTCVGNSNRHSKCHNVHLM